MSVENDRLIRALLRQPVDRTPVWMMRQAGRYLPEYRAVRKKLPNFMQFCRTIDAVTEVTLQPLERFALDAAIIFSDILTVPQAMGIDLAIEPQRGPVIHNPITCASDVEKLSSNTVAELQYVADAIVSVKKALNNRVPLIGFAGSPWTIATYVVEGGSSKLFHTIKRMMYAEPKLMHALLQKITDLTIDYLIMQMDAGVDVVQVFDSWGGVLSGNAYQEFSLNYMRRIVEALKLKDPKIPVILFTKGGGQWLELMADTGCDALGLDWTTDLSVARQRVGDKVALQGNLDPAVLLSTPEAVTTETKKVLAAYGEGTGHVFNLGHGINKDTPIENVEAMFAVFKETV
ncbi:MAG: uroporphyrinogen decarboxylase [Coxiellaceae bacterium]|nr:uroporphyrinogen decarboxylase [Coxiellaceae bacterium]